MPRTAFDKQPEIDWLLAAMLERKLKQHKNFEELASKVNCDPTTLRKMFSAKHTDDWNPEIRRSVCRALGISQKTIISADIESADIELK